MNTTAASTNPMPEGIDETPTIKIVKGIQNHTRPIAAPVIIDAVGTTPMVRGRDVSAGCSAAIGSVLASGLVSVTATMPTTYGPGALRDTAFSREPCGGKPPRSVTSTSI